MGRHGSYGFTRGDRCSIGNNYLPEYMSTVADYHSKAFCGLYSKCGNYFLSASQGKFETILFLAFVLLLFLLINRFIIF